MNKLTSLWHQSRKFTQTTLVALSTFIVIAAPVLPASADTAPNGVPATMSIDALPTVQVNGIVWAQVVVGNTVYVTGRFTEARLPGLSLTAPCPAGVTTCRFTRTNLLAYDITTGKLDPAFVHSLTGANAVNPAYDSAKKSPEGYALAASPDGKRLYVGGKFTIVDGQARSNFAAFDLTTNKLVNGFTAGANNTVKAIAATNTNVYIGGTFSKAGNQTHNRLAAYGANGTILSTWSPQVALTAGSIGGPYVAALVIPPNRSNLIVGGYFNQINTATTTNTYYSTGAVSLSTGNPVPWASQSASYPIRDQVKPTGDSAHGVGITSLTADANQVYLTSYHYAGTNGDGAFEGTAAVNPDNGNIIWANDCHGDTYSAFPIGYVLYSVSHAHDCSAIGGFPESPSRRALASTTYPTGNNGHTPNPEHGYTDYFGWSSSTLLHWYPYLNTGDKSGASQAAWSVTGNANYIVLGGEFTKADGLKYQQGLVRYTWANSVPGGPKMGPTAYTTPGISTTTADASGNAQVSFQTTSDNDNAQLTYYFYRNGSTTPFRTQTISTAFWTNHTETFTDSGITPGTTPQYRMVVQDLYGNSVTTSNPAR